MHRECCRRKQEACSLVYDCVTARHHKVYLSRTHSQIVWGHVCEDEMAEVRQFTYEFGLSCFVTLYSNEIKQSRHTD